MWSEITNTKAWKRKMVPFSKARATTLHLHMQKYHDELVRDMGLSPYLKQGVFAWLKEAFSPYQPSDYAEIASGEKFCTASESQQPAHDGRVCDNAAPIRLDFDVLKLDQSVRVQKSGTAGVSLAK